MNSLRCIVAFAVLLALGAVPSMVVAQSSQQVIGTFPQMDGGFEGQLDGVLVGTSVASGAQRTDWTTSSSGLGTIYSTGSRTGAKYMNAWTTSTAKRWQSPTVGDQAMPNSTQYTVQYYYRTSSSTATAASMQVGVSVDGTSLPIYYPASAPFISLPGTSGAWTKYAAQVTSSGSGSAVPRYGVGVIRANTPTMGIPIDVDDFVVYPGAEDTSVPDAPTSPAIANAASTQLDVQWTAPGSGVDGGGYMVVRGLADPTTSPNANGLYSVGSTVATGEVVAYLGTAASFTDLGLTSGTTYYYRIYTVDKAFNYSTAATVSGATTSGGFASEPTVQASGASFSNVTSSSFDITWTSGNGTNRVVLVKAGSAVDADPSDGSSYTANAAFGTGSQIGTGNYVVYNGASNTVSVTGLSKVSTYYVAIYEFNGTGGTENYLITTPATGSQMTLPGSITSTQTGNWGLGTTWVGGVVPTAGDDVTIATGHTVTTEASGKNCYNLTVQSGAFLVGDLPLPTSSIRYVRIYGTSMTVDGTVGDATTGNSVAIEGAATGGTITISGTGTFAPSRLRINSGASNCTIVFNMDTKFMYTGSGGLGGNGLYPQTDNNTFTLNAGKTMTFVANSSLAVGSGGSATAQSLTLNIHGTVDLSQLNSNLYLKVTAGKTATLNVSSTGSITVGGTLYASTVADGGTSAVTVDGSLSVAGGADFSNPAFVLTGTGSFTLPSGATLKIGHPDGIAASGASGQIQSTTRSFSSGATYSFEGTAAQVPGTGLPSNVAGLTLNNALGLTLGGNQTVDGTLTLTSGNISTGANTLIIGSSGAVSRTSGHVVGTLQKNVPTGSAVARSFEVGTGADYAPVDVLFANVSTAGDLSATTVAGDHPNLATSNIDPAKSANRYWTMTNSGVGFDAYDATLNFVSGDVDVTANPANFSAEKYSGGSWTGLTEGTPGLTSTQILGATSFSDFAVGEQVGAPPTPGFVLNPVSLSFGGVVLPGSLTDSVWVFNPGAATLNITSAVSDNSPVFTVLPASATVPAGDSAGFAVTFTPAGSGAASGNIVFTHDATGSPTSLPLSGSGLVSVTVMSNGIGGGSWNDGTTWSTMAVPGIADSVVILAGDSVHVPGTTSVTVGSLTILSNAKLANLSGSGADSLQVTRVFTIQSDGWFYGGGANVTSWPVAASYVIDNASTYVQSAGGRDVIGAVGRATFGNLINARTVSGSAVGTSLTIYGNLTVKTGSSSNTFRGATATSGNTSHHVYGNVDVISGQWSAVDGAIAGLTGVWNVDGNVTVGDPSAPSLARFGPLSSAGNNLSRRGTFNIAGNLTLRNGVRFQAGSTSPANDSSEIGVINIGGNFSTDATVTTATNSNGIFAINFVGSGTQTVTLGAPLRFATTNPGNRFTLYDTIAAGSTVVFNGGKQWSTTIIGAPRGVGDFLVLGSLALGPQDTIGGVENFILAPGATLKIGSASGISMDTVGNVLVSGTRTFSSTANYAYNGTAAQLTGNALPSSVNSLTIDNANGVSLVSGVNTATLNLTAGPLVTGGNVMEVAAGGTVSRTAGHVNGLLRKTVPVSGGVGSQSYEIGDNAVYAPVTITGAAYAISFPVTASTTPGDHPNLAGSGINGAKSVNRFYTLTGTPSGPSDVTFNFVSGDLDGGANTAAFIVGKYDSPTWTLPAVGVRTATSTQATGITSFSDFAIGEPPVATNNVTFRVNMKVKALAGMFDPTADAVTVRGSFNDWGNSTNNPDTLTDGDNDSIYVKTIALAPNTSYQYKFWKTLRGGMEWEDGVNPNRQVDLGSADTTLPAPYFNNDGPDVAVTFQVNMSVKMQEGTFLPDSGDVVVARGNFNAWGESAAFTDGDADSIYTATLQVPSGQTITYKFFKTLRGGLNWEADPNRTYVIPLETPTVIPPDYFDRDSVVNLPVFTADPPALAFGTLTVGDSLTLTVNAINTGSGTLNISGAVITGSTDYTLSGTTPVAVAPSDTAVFQVRFLPSSAGPIAGSLDFTHDAAGSPTSVVLSGTGVPAGPAPKFLSVSPDTIIAKDPIKGKFLKPVKRAKPGKPIIPPNWANLLDETVAQGGFQPGASESDSAGGMVIGVSHMYLKDPFKNKWAVIKDSGAVRAWVRLTKWDFKKSIGKSFNALQKTLETKAGKHDLMPARGFDFTTDGKNKPLVKQLTKLDPKKQDNALFGEMVALKLNIAASALGKIPTGFGDLIFDRNTSGYDEQTVLQIAASVDQMMTYWQLFDSSDFADAYTTVYDINRAFVGPLDTVSFIAGNLVLVGQVEITSVPYLKVPTPFIATTMAPTTTEYESLEDFELDDEEFEEGSVPVAAKLYQNYPNPFNPGTTISFRLLETSQVTIRIYDMLGQVVATLLTGEEMEEGYNEVRFNADGLSSGVYFYQIDAQGLDDAGLHSVVTNKMVLLK